MQVPPEGVRQAITAIWIVIAISALAALIGKQFGMSKTPDFVAAIFVYALCCAIPYKLANRSNATRYFYAVLIAASYLLMAAGIGSMNRLDFWLSIALIPVEAFILYRLFQPEASAWYTSA